MNEDGGRKPSMELRTELSAREAVDGSVVLVQIVPPAGMSKADVSAQFESIQLPVFEIPSAPGVYQAVLGVPYNHKPGDAEVEVRYGTGENAKVEKLRFAIVDGKYPSEVLRVSKRHVNPKKKDLIRIKKEVAEVGELYKRITPEKMWKGAFALPINSPVTSVFGTKRVFNGEMQSFHQGVDLKAGIGAPINAAAPGVVVLAKDLFFTGNTVILDHGFGIFTIYAHLNGLNVKKGQRVDAGDLLGPAGMTGRASGPHLHWGAVIHRAKVNPLDLTKVMQ